MSFKPMLACSTIPSTQDLDYPILTLPKFDGIRCLIVNGVPVSRNLKPIPNKFIRDTLAQIPNLSGMDGELMLRTGDFNNVQSAIMSESGAPDFVYVVFDNFSLETGFQNRLAYAETIVERMEHKRLSAATCNVAKNKEELEAFHSQYLADGYEGSILRSTDGPYKHGRSTLKQGWMLKLKNFYDDEAKVIGFEELMHNDNDATIDALGHQVRSRHQANQVAGNMLGALICELKDGGIFKIGTGFDSNQRKHIWDRQDKYFDKMVTYKYQELSRYGKPRFPVFKGFRHTGDMS